MGYPSLSVLLLIYMYSSKEYSRVFKTPYKLSLLQLLGTEEIFSKEIMIDQLQKKWMHRILLWGISSDTVSMDGV